MTIIDYDQVKLTADDGKVIVDQSGSIYGKEVWLALDRSPAEFMEIADSELIE